MSEANKPVKSFRAGGIEASIWENEIQQGGQQVTRHSVTIRKQYRDKDGNWKESSTFFPNDLPRLVLVAQRAFEHVALNESADKEDAPA